MRALFTTLPGLGHFHPMVSIAQALKKEGHDVAFAAAPCFRSKIARAGFASFPAGLDWAESEAEQSFPELEAMVPDKQGLWLVTNVFADVAPSRMIPALLEVCDTWKPDLIVRGEFEFAGGIVAERLDIPCAVISLGLFLPLEMWRPIIGKRLAHVRAACGLAPDPELTTLHGQAYMAFAPPSYQFPDCRLPSAFHAFRPVPFDQSGDEELPAWIQSLPQWPTVHVSLGTTFAFAADVLEDVITGLADTPLNVVVTTGSGRNRRWGKPAPANVHVETYIPHSRLLPHCDLVVTHGGAGTTLSALFHALPLVVIPLSNDQPFHAMRCAALEVGHVVKRPGQFDPYLLDRHFAELSPGAIREAVETVLGDDHYRRNALRLREEMMALPGPERAAELLMQLI